MKLEWSETITVEKSMEADWVYMPVSMTENLRIGHFEASIFPNWAGETLRAVLNWYDPADESKRTMVDMVVDPVFSHATIREMLEQFITEQKHRGYPA